MNRQATASAYARDIAIVVELMIGAMVGHFLGVALAMWTFGAIGVALLITIYLDSRPEKVISHAGNPLAGWTLCKSPGVDSALIVDEEGCRRSGLVTCPQCLIELEKIREWRRDLIARQLRGVERRTDEI